MRRLIGLVESARHGTPEASGLVVTLNPEMVMLFRRDAGFRAALESAALLVPDGIGVVRGVRRRGAPGLRRVAGADLVAAYLPQAAKLGHRVALAGGGPGVARRAADRLRRENPGLQVVAAEGGAPDFDLARRLEAARPDTVLAAFGHGRQELFINYYLRSIGAGAGIGVGGTLDYLAGTARRAPQSVQSAGLEWAWRLALQPWRLHRQLVLPQYWVLERAEAARSGRGGDS